MVTSAKLISDQVMQEASEFISTDYDVLPKFIGILSMFGMSQSLDIPFVLHAKLICEHGTHTNTMVFASDGFQHIKNPTEVFGDQRSVIVTELSASVHPQCTTFKKFRRMRQKCPHNLFNTKKGCHDKKNSCILCTPHKQSCKHASNHLQSLIFVPFNLLHGANAASFTAQCQKPLLDDLKKQEHICNSLQALFS